MSFDTLIFAVRRLTESTEALAVLGAELRLRRDAVSGDPSLRELLTGVATAIEPSLLDGLDAVQELIAQAAIETSFRQAADLLERPARPPGWFHDDPLVLEGRRLASRLIFYVMRAGCPWRLMPNDPPPWETIYRWFAAWRDDGRFERINHALVIADRERVGPPRPAGHAVTMRARRSRDASAMRSLTPTAAASSSNRIRRASRIATAAGRCSVSRADHSRSFSASSPTAGMPARRSPRPR